jgi:hypothetical protein
VTVPLSDPETQFSLLGYWRGKNWETVMWQDWGGGEEEIEKDGAEKRKRRRIKEKFKNKHSRMDGEVN